MFVREHQNQFRGAQADVQKFYGNFSNVTSTFGWNKPVGTSFIYIMLIGAGGAGNVGPGGGSGSISVWFGMAKNIPNSLIIQISRTNTLILTSVGSSQKTFLTANAASTTTGGTTTALDGYSASGFYQSTAGDNGTTGVATASSTSFLQAGGAASPSSSAASYGYTRLGSPGYLLLSPVPVGVSPGSTSDASAAAAYGCGHNSGNLGGGGPGMALIASW